MFNPADFDALTAEIEKRHIFEPERASIAITRFRLLTAVSTVKLLAKEYGMMAPEPAPVHPCQEERLTALLDQWEKRIEDLNKEFNIAKAAGRWQHVIQLEAYAVELMARRNEIRDMLKQSPIRLCHECGAAPTIAAYSRMCESCMRSRLLKELELAQEQPAACSNCGAAPELPYATLCQECYTAFIDGIKQRQMRATSAVLDAIAASKKERWYDGPTVDYNGDPLNDIA